MIKTILEQLNNPNIGILAGGILLVLIVFYWKERTTQKWMDFVLRLRDCDNVKMDKKVQKKKKSSNNLTPWIPSPERM